MIHPLRFGNFTILYPWVLLFLLAVPVLFLLGRKVRSAAQAVQFPSTEIMLALSRGGKSRARGFLDAITFLAVALLLLAASRPQLERSNIHIQASGVDIMLAFDVSSSMAAEDMTIANKRVSRIEAVKRIAQQFIAERLSDRIGIMAFAGHPFLVSPPTLDHGWLLTNIDRMQAGMMEEDSTAIGSAIAAAARRLRGHFAKSKVLILLTDGANNAGCISPLTAAEAARVLGIKIYTIGAGSSGPVPYPVLDIFGGTRYRMVKFDSDLDTLKRIAEMTGGQFFRASDSQSLTRIFQKVNRMEKSRAVMTKISSYWDLFPWPVSVALGLLLAEILLSQTVWKRLP
ncbi:von Willebrand factor type A domain protein [Candidatus Xiphinematobacter sp. Idaho Grape]|uniref:vWA domain-containing protein n=1 Tax=Candidatus Xiphinematobacter sp. Idaho Grape TaxID=1704307 RepID=UPI00070630DC|nr:VWA domain-containing protein [Candidatus Xiphinematobacter sp. Idaho Grape]ALJ56431.1 von Willebrand factor type A domain protein [Candidatus Xiphinematobacter sp. Idaho Grape]